MVKIELNGECSDINNLATLLDSETWEINESETKHYLCSSVFDHLVKSREVIAIADKYLDHLNGIACIYDFNHTEVKSGSLTRVDQHNKQHVFFFPETGHFTIQSGTPPPSGKWIEKANKYEKVSDALRYFKKISWLNLYKVYEVISDDVGLEVVYGYVGKSNIKLFTHNANNQKATGDDARHAVNKNLPPKKMLSLKEAHFLIKELFEKWIATKI